MRIRIESHTLVRATERGATETEIVDVMRTGTPLPVRDGRWRKGKTYDFRQMRLGKFYDQKRIEVVYVVDRGEMVTVTVYVFYGKWE